MLDVTTALLTGAGLVGLAVAYSFGRMQAANSTLRDVVRDLQITIADQNRIIDEAEEALEIAAEEVETAHEEHEKTLEMVENGFPRSNGPAPHEISEGSVGPHGAELTRVDPSEVIAIIGAECGPQGAKAIAARLFAAGIECFRIEFVPQEAEDEGEFA